MALEKNNAHTIAPYTIRCFNKEMRKDESNKYFLLNSIAGRDLYTVFKKFIQLHSTQLIKKDVDKRAYKFEEITYNDKDREIYGWMRHGIYGVGTDIVDIDKGSIVYDKKENNAEMISYYFHLFIPYDRNEGICIMHAYRGDGVKTVFFEEFNNFFKRTVNPELTITARPLAYEAALKDWMLATTKEIKVISYQGVKDKADRIKGFGHTEATLVLKPEKKGTHLGRFIDFLTPNTPQIQAVEMLEAEGSQVKTVVQLGNRKRVFRVGSNNDNPICQIDIDESVTLKRGMPELKPLNKWVSTIISEFCSKIYPSEAIYNELKD